MSGEGAPDGVQGEAAHLLADVEDLPAAGVLRPAGRGGPCGLGDPLLVAAHPASGELGLEQSPLALPRLAGRGQDAVAEQEPGAVRAFDVQVGPQREDVLDGVGGGDQDGRARAEPERGDAAEACVGLGEQVDELPSPGLPVLHEGGVQLGDRAGGRGRDREGAGAGVGGHGSAPVRRLCVVTDRFRHHAL